MRNNRGIQEARAKLLSRVWVCRECGTKVYCGKMDPRPSVDCLCGKCAWRRSGVKLTTDT